MGGTRATQGQSVDSLQKWFDSTAQFGPELDLARDGTFGNFAREAGVQNQFVGEFDWLTHGNRVAKGYWLSMT